MITSLYNWYTIPGFSSYDINIHNKSIRSNKHFNSGHHIMKVKSNKVTIVDDFGKPQRIDIDNLYNITFNSGKKLRPRGDNDYYKSGMIKGARNSIPEVVKSKEDDYIILDFYGAALGKANLIKPFTLDLDEN